MKVEAITQDNLEAFFTYCRTHRKEVDDSYLYEEDLAEFVLGEENPSFVITNKGATVAAASLVLDDYHRRGKRGRFRIFHAENRDPQVYRQLLDALRPSLSDLDYIFVFVPDEDPITGDVLKSLDFFVERSSYLLLRDTDNLPELPPLSEPLRVQIFRPGMDETHWVTVRNRGFAKLLGSQTPLLEAQVVKMTQEKDYLPEGMMMIYDGNQPVGIVRGTDDEYEGEPTLCIGPLAIIPEYQGRGLGRYLLRAIVRFAKEKGYKQVYLSVNAENEGAKALYLKEGFWQEEAVHCYRLNCM